MVILKRAALVSALAATLSTVAATTAAASSATALTPQITDSGDAAASSTISESFTAPDGQNGQYHLIDDHIDSSQPVGLIVQLHGDGAGSFQNYPRGVGKLTEMQAVAEEQNMVLLAARTPSFEEGDRTWWNGDGTGKADYLAELITAVGYSGHDVDRSKVWFSGYSGGAEQLTYHFLTRHLDLVSGGGALLTGGGGAYGDISAPAAAKENFRLHWLTGSEDHTGSFCGVCAAEDGQEHYASQGFQQTTLDVREGYSHYELQELEAATLNQLIAAN